MLLKRDGVTLSGYVPKVADFGMSVRMSAHQSHVSNVWQGTQFYAAPEQMEQVGCEGNRSRYYDTVYACGRTAGRHSLFAGRAYAVMPAM